MKKAVLFLSLLAMGLEALAASPPARAPKPAAAAGVTPGGLLYSVVPSARKLKLYGLDGGTRAVFDLQPGERYVIGVADTGARVTSNAAREIRKYLSFVAEMGKPAAPRLVFRDAMGNVLATRDPKTLKGSTVEARGDEAYFVRRVGRDYVVFRTNAAEAETAIVRTPADRLLRETGRVNDVKLHASAAGLVVEFRGPYRSVYIDAARPDRFTIPDPALSCGTERYAPVYPRASGGISRVASSTSSAQLESFDAAGRPVRSLDLEPASRFEVLPDGALLAMRGSEIFVLDEHGREASRVALPPDEEGVATTLSGGQGFSRPLRAGATGAEWVEAVLKSGEPADGEAVAARDPEGVVTRFARVLDGDPAFKRVRGALGKFFDTRGYEYVFTEGPRASRPGTQAPAAPPDRWERVLKTAGSLAVADAPVWFRQVVARALLSNGAETAPPWTVEVIAEAVSSGQGMEDVALLAEAAFTPLLAEIVSASERARLDRLEPLPPFDPAAFAPGDMNAMRDFYEAMESRQLHLPAARFPALVLSCASGATPDRFEAVTQALMIPGATLMWGEMRSPVDEEDEAAQTIARGKNEEAAAAVTGLLAAALHGDDADQRALAQVLSPFYRLSIDPTAWRRDVLARPGIESTAIPALLLDQSLPSADWTRLMADALAAARARAADPVGCLSSPMRSMLDPYCKVLGGVFEFLMYGADRPGAPQNLRRAEVLAFARSRDAPAEIRLQGQLVRVMTGSATAVEILEIWREKELPREVRRGSLVAPQGRSAPVGFPEALERELRSERLSSEDGAMLLQALRNADKGAAHRLALERWEEGEVVLESGSSDDHQTSPWIASLEPQDAAASPRIHAALRVLMEDEKHGPEAAALLSKTGDPDALPRVLEAVRTGCLA
jgi:hypothetical protein